MQFNVIEKKKKKERVRTSRLVNYAIDTVEAINVFLNYAVGSVHEQF